MGTADFKTIVDPIFKKYPCGEIVLIRPTKNEAVNHIKTYYDETESNRRKFQDLDMRVREVTVDPDEYEQIFEELTKIVREYISGDHNIFINMSSAPELVMIAMITAAYSMPNTKKIKLLMHTPNAYVLHERSRNRCRTGSQKTSDFDPRVSSLSMNKARAHLDERFDYNIEIPIFPTEEIPQDLLNIMKALYRFGGVDSIKEILEEIDTQRSTLQYRLDKLEEMNLIHRQPTTNGVKLQLTRAGEMYVKANSC